MIDAHCEQVLVRDGTNDDDWLDARRNGITGSDALAAMGMDPRKHRVQLWQEKVEGRFDIEETEPMMMGRILEPAVKRAFEWKSGLEVIDSDVLLRSRTWPHMLATPDGYVRDAAGQLGIFEAKTTRAWLGADWDEGQIPARAAAQTMHYLAVTGLPFAFVAVLIDNRVTYRYVERDEELIDTIVRLETEFWQMVEARTMPPLLVGEGPRGDVIAAMWPDHTAGKVVELTDTQERVVAAYRQANEQFNHWKARKDELGEELRVLAEDAETLAWQGRPIATLKAQTSNRVDTKKLRDLYPRAADECTVQSTTRVLRLTKEKAS